MPAIALALARPILQLGRPATRQRSSRVVRTRGVIGSTRLAEAVLPCVTSSEPLRPFSHVTFSQRSR